MSLRKPPTLAQIFYHDIGDYLTREEKLAKITAFKSLAGISAANGWQPITPDAHHDWVGQRDDRFAEFMSLGDKKDASAVTVFENYSGGIKTNRDAWVYNASKNELQKNMQNMATFYNEEVERYRAACEGLPKEKRLDVDSFISNDDSKISWGGNLKNDLSRLKANGFRPNLLTVGLYRPFTKQNVYFDSAFIERTYQMSKIFPNSEAKNRVISVTGLGTPKDFSAVMTDALPDIQLQANGQCFPEYIYDAAIAS